MPVFFADTLAAAALTRLRAAVAAAAAGSPFQTLFIPATRQRQIPEGTLSSVFCYAAGEIGQGVSRHIPTFRITDRLNIDGFVAQGAEVETDLDQAVATLVQAILDLLLEDTTFLELFGWVASCNVSKQDVQTGKEARELDIVEFRIELEVGGGQTTYAPQPPSDAVPLQTVALEATIGDVTVEADVALPQP